VTADDDNYRQRFSLWFFLKPAGAAAVERVPATRFRAFHDGTARLDDRFRHEDGWVFAAEVLVEMDDGKATGGYKADRGWKLRALDDGFLDREHSMGHMVAVLNQVGTTPEDSEARFGQRRIDALHRWTLTDADRVAIEAAIVKAATKGRAPTAAGAMKLTGHGELPSADEYLAARPKVEHPAPWRWVGRWESDRESSIRFEALTGPGHEKLAIVSGGYVMFMNPRTRALTEASSQLRDELEWALGVIDAAADYPIPFEDIGAGDSPGVLKRVRAARALLAEIEERSKGVT
jgi:hypothetical protein